MIEAIYTGLWYGFAAGSGLLALWLTAAFILGVMDLLNYIMRIDIGERTDERRPHDRRTDRERKE